jgi:hypothetical protein
MREGRASFVDLLGRVDAYLTLSGQKKRLPGLEAFWRAAEGSGDKPAARAFKRLLRVALGEGFDAELLPFVEASRLWCLRLQLAPPHAVRAPGPGPGRRIRRADGR